MRKFLILIFLLILLTPLFLFSQEIEYPTVPGARPPTAETTFPQYVQYLFNLAIRIAGLITLAVIIWGGILYLTSGGDVSQKVEAKNKITGALLGLFILLCSYLILWTINPQLLTLSLQPVEPTGGIYLIDKKDDKRHLLTDTAAEISIDVKEIKFVSSADPLALYIYDKKDFGGDEKRIPNTGGIVSLDPPLFSPKSIYFLWNKSGVYLCSTTTSDGDIFDSKTICPKRPLYTNLRIPDLSQTKPYFDNLAKSLQFVDNYQAVLFTDPGYERKCSYVLEEKADNLSASTTLGYNNPPIGNSTTSSVVASLNQAPESGEVKFYNRINCKGGDWSTSTGGVGWRDISATTTKFSDGTLVYENILSLKIPSGLGVLLNTETDGSGECQFFEKPEGETDCINLIGSAVYQPEPEPATPGNQTKKVRSVYIFYHQE